MPTQISCNNTNMHHDSKDRMLIVKINQMTSPLGTHYKFSDSGLYLLILANSGNLEITGNT